MLVLLASQFVVYQLNASVFFFSCPLCVILNMGLKISHYTWVLVNYICDWGMLFSFLDPERIEKWQILLLKIWYGWEKWNINWWPLRFSFALFLFPGFRILLNCYFRKIGNQFYLQFHSLKIYMLLYFWLHKCLLLNFLVCFSGSFGVYKSVKLQQVQLDIGGPICGFICSLLLSPWICTAGLFFKLLFTFERSPCLCNLLNKHPWDPITFLAVFASSIFYK